MSAPPSVNTGESGESAHVEAGLNALLIIGLVATALYTGHILRKYNCTWLPDSGSAMILGFIVGAFMHMLGLNQKGHEVLSFSPELFFYILLPPIILEAGYSMKRASFFRNMGVILMFAILGTLVSTLVIGYGLYGIAKLGFIELNTKDPIEALMFGSLMSAVDPVATLSILGSPRVNSDPLLNSLVFGESVLNDAVSIVLFNTLKNMNGDTTSLSSDSTVQHAFISFLTISIGSLIMGVSVSLVCCLLFKYTAITEHHDHEFAIVIFFSYASYCLSEIMGLSGIMAIFFNAIILAHYNSYNLSPAARVTTKVAFKTFALIAETFLFCYLGITAVVSFSSDSLGLQWSFSLIFWTLVLALLSRGFIFP